MLWAKGKGATVARGGARSPVYRGKRRRYGTHHPPTPRSRLASFNFDIAARMTSRSKADCLTGAARGSRRVAKACIERVSGGRVTPARRVGHFCANPPDRSRLESIPGTRPPRSGLCAFLLSGDMGKTAHSFRRSLNHGFLTFRQSIEGHRRIDQFVHPPSPGRYLRRER